MRIHTCMHACMHACIHTYIHTDIYALGSGATTPPPPPMVSPPPPHGPPAPPLPQARAAARTCQCCRLGQSGICAAIVSRTRHELQLLNYGLYGDGVGGSCSLMVLMMKMTTTMMMFSMMSKMIRLSTRIAVWTQHHEQYHRQQAQLRTRPTKASAGWGCTAHHNNETTGGGGAGKGTTTGPIPQGGGGGYHGVGGGRGGVAALHHIYMCVLGAARSLCACLPV